MRTDNLIASRVASRRTNDLSRSAVFAVLACVFGLSALGAVESVSADAAQAVVLTARAAPSAEVLSARHAAQRASIAAASRVKTQPERLSPDFPPKPFAVQAFVADREAYLSVIEPGRCWACAPDDSQAPELVAVGASTQFTVRAGGVVDLVLAAPAGAPVSLTSFDGGAFPNGLNAITVETGADGRASTTWTATPGTEQGVRIVAASPLARGTVSFAVQIQGFTTAPEHAGNGGVK